MQTRKSQPREERRNTGLRLSPEVHKGAKVAAALESVPLEVFVQDVLHSELVRRNIWPLVHADPSAS